MLCGVCVVSLDGESFEHRSRKPLGNLRIKFVFWRFVLSAAQIKIISYAISGCGLPTTCVVYSGLEMMVSCVAVSALAVNHHRVGEISDESVHHYTLEVPMGWSICISVFCNYRSTTERVVANGKSCSNHVLATLPSTAQVQ